jgi:hypothetical protein
MSLQECMIVGVQVDAVRHGLAGSDSRGVLKAFAEAAAQDFIGNR